MRGRRKSKDKIAQKKIEEPNLPSLQELLAQGEGRAKIIDKFNITVQQHLDKRIGETVQQYETRLLKYLDAIKSVEELVSKKTGTKKPDDSHYESARRNVIKALQAHYMRDLFNQITDIIRKRDSLSISNDPIEIAKMIEKIIKSYIEDYNKLDLSRESQIRVSSIVAEYKKNITDINNLTWAPLAESETAFSRILSENRSLSGIDNFTSDLKEVLISITELTTDELGIINKIEREADAYVKDIYESAERSFERDQEHKNEIHHDTVMEEQIDDSAESSNEEDPTIQVPRMKDILESSSDEDNVNNSNLANDLAKAKTRIEKILDELSIIANKVKNSSSSAECTAFIKEFSELNLNLLDEIKKINEWPIMEITEKFPDEIETLVSEWNRDVQSFITRSKNIRDQFRQNEAIQLTKLESQKRHDENNEIEHTTAEETRKSKAPQLKNLQIKKDEDYTLAISLPHGKQLGICEVNGNDPYRKQEDAFAYNTGKTSKEFSNFPVSTQQAVMNELFDDLQNKAGNNDQKGSCACVATGIIQDDQAKIFTSYAGDSVAFLIVVDDKGNLKSAQACNPELHDGKNEKEIERIGKNNFSYDARLGAPRLGGLIAVTRSFGDKSLVKLGFSHQPQTTNVAANLASGDRAFMVVGCDSTMEHLKGDNSAKQYANELGNLFAGKIKNDINISSSQLSEAVVENALLKGSNDNITAMVVPLSTTAVTAAVFDGHGGNTVSHALSAEFNNAFENAVQNHLKASVESSAIAGTPRKNSQPDNLINEAARINLQNAIQKLSDHTKNASVELILNAGNKPDHWRITGTASPFDLPFVQAALKKTGIESAIKTEYSFDSKRFQYLVINNPGDMVSDEFLISKLKENFDQAQKHGDIFDIQAFAEGYGETPSDAEGHGETPTDIVTDEFDLSDTDFADKIGTILISKQLDVESVSDIENIANELLSEIESPNIFKDDKRKSISARVSYTEASLDAIDSILTQAQSLNDSIQKMESQELSDAESQQLLHAKDTVSNLTNACAAATREPKMLLRSLRSEIIKDEHDHVLKEAELDQALAEKSNLLTQWNATMQRMNNEIQRLDAQLRRGDITLTEARQIQADLIRQNEWLETDSIGKNLMAKMNNIAGKLPVDLDIQKALHERIDVANARNAAMKLASDTIVNLTSISEAPVTPVEPVTPVTNDKYYFFATTPEEYKQQKSRVDTLSQNFSKAIQIAERAEHAAQKLAHSTTMAKKRGEVIKKLDNQIHELKLLRGILQDNIRRRENINIDPHDSSRVRTPELIDTPINGSIETIRNNLQRVDNCIEKLEAARSSIQNIAETGPEQTVYYSRRSDAKEFGNNKDAAIAAIETYFKTYNRAMPTSDNAATCNINEEAGISDKILKSANFRFIPMDVVTKTGSAPAGILQETNDEKSYAKQSIYIKPVEMTALNNLPLRPDAKEQKLMEQMLFVANIVETAMAATNALGPVSVKNLPDNLSKAAAAYCQRMGYDFNPKSITDNLKPKDKAMYNMVTDKLMKENNEFAKMVQDAEARKELKKGYLPPAPIRK
ncbi:MAG TPA: hypothetical protein VL360_07950 [Gammaproteobacteria bacterium]|nr:hypothetical protein [Gammaproteobacteria bacterium]